MSEILDTLEGQLAESAEHRNDRADLFRCEPEIIKAVEGYKAEIAAIRQAAEELGSDMRRAAKLNETLEDGDVRNSVQQYREMAALAARIEGGIAWLNGLDDTNFDFTPYPRSKDEWSIVVRRMSHELGQRCYFGAPAMAMRRYHEHVMSRLPEINRTSKAQGKDPFARKRTAEVPPEAMSSDALDIQIRAGSIEPGMNQAGQ